jgi:hypothetical protein
MKGKCENSSGALHCHIDFQGLDQVDDVCQIVMQELHEQSNFLREGNSI